MPNYFAPFRLKRVMRVSLAIIKIVHSKVFSTLREPSGPPKVKFSQIILIGTHWPTDDHDMANKKITDHIAVWLRQF